MTTTRTYASTDTGAPVLTGEAGTLANVLQKCLVDGYGSKAGAGWTAPFTGANKVALRNSLAVGGTGHYFRIQDDAADALGARVAWLRGYVDMTDVDTPVGADIMPRVDWCPNGERLKKSDTADNVAREWMVWADELTCWYWIALDGAGEMLLCGFGDIDTFVPADAYHSFVCGCKYTVAASTIRGRLGGGAANTLGVPNTENETNLWLMRGYAGTGASMPAGVATIAIGVDVAERGTSGGAAAVIPSALAPGVYQRIYMPAYVATENSIRGRLRGLYYLLNDVGGVGDGTLESSAAGLAVGAAVRLKVTYRYVSVAAYSAAVGIEEVLAW